MQPARRHQEEPQGPSSFQGKKEEEAYATKDLPLYCRAEKPSPQMIPSLVHRTNLFRSLDSLWDGLPLYFRKCKRHWIHFETQYVHPKNTSSPRGVPVSVRLPLAQEQGHMISKAYALVLISLSESLPRTKEDLGSLVQCTLCRLWLCDDALGLRFSLTLRTNSLGVTTRTWEARAF